MKTTALGFSTLLIAVGAVMAWAITVEAEGADLNMIGLILFFVGIAGFIGSFALAATPSRSVVQEERTDVKIDTTR